MKRCLIYQALPGQEIIWDGSSGSRLFLTDGVKYVIDELGVLWLISSTEYFLTEKTLKPNFPIF